MILKFWAQMYGHKSAFPTDDDDDDDGFLFFSLAVP